MLIKNDHKASKSNQFERISTGIIESAQTSRKPEAFSRNLVSKSRFCNPFLSNSTKNKHKKHLKISEELEVSVEEQSEEITNNRGSVK